MWLKAVVTITGIILLGLIWFVFAPAQIGGQAVYLVISGISMEPRFHEGDLVILRQAADYQVGDIAAYYDPRTQGTIIHRIIARDADRFVLQGINNSWVDPHQPTPAEMQGKFWLHVPDVGRTILYVRSQVGLSILIAVILLLFLWSVVSRPKNQRASLGPAKYEESPPMEQPGFSKLDTLLVLAMLSITFLLLALFAFSRPLLGLASEPIVYQQRGTFGYSATAPPGIYGANRVQTGEPVFRQLINQVSLSFDYAFETELPATLEGTYRLTAEIGHRNGWRWRLELLPETAFQGDSFQAASRLDLVEIEAIIHNLEQQAGLSPQAYTLTIRPEVSIVGQVAGLPLHDSFAPPLAFDLTPTELKLAAPDPATLSPEQSGRLARTIRVPNAISLPGFTVRVTTVRQLALLGLVVSTAALLAFGWFFWRTRQPGEAARIQLKYGSRLVSVADAGFAAKQDIVTVSGIDDLARLAEQHGLMMLHHREGNQHTYWVKGNGLAFRYQVAAPPLEVRARPVEEAQ